MKRIGHGRRRPGSGPVPEAKPEDLAQWILSSRHDVAMELCRDWRLEAAQKQPRWRDLAAVQRRLKALEADDLTQLIETYRTVILSHA